MGKKFTLGAALLFEETAGKPLASLKEYGLADLIAMLYAQEFWDVQDRPSFDEFKMMAGSWDLSELSERLNAPFSPRAAQ